MPGWTFLTKHALVLSLIGKHPQITGHELAGAIGTTERQIRKVIADLYECGYISKKKLGRGLKYNINTDLKLRHNTHQEIDVGDFLAALEVKRKKRQIKIS